VLVFLIYRAVCFPVRRLMHFDFFELQVETFGAMAKTEKIAFILEQVHISFFCLRFFFYLVLVLLC
jgi:hypothetical protein